MAQKKSKSSDKAKSLISLMQSQEDNQDNTQSEKKEEKPIKEQQKQQEKQPAKEQMQKEEKIEDGNIKVDGKQEDNASKAKQDDDIKKESIEFFLQENKDRKTEMDGNCRVTQKNINRLMFLAKSAGVYMQDIHNNILDAFFEKYKNDILKLQKKKEKDLF